MMHANKRTEMQEASAGEIVAVVGLRFTQTGESLADSKHPILFEKMIFPEPVISIAIEPKSQADQEKLFESLKKMSLEPHAQVAPYDAFSSLRPETQQLLALMEESTGDGGSGTIVEMENGIGEVASGRITGIDTTSEGTRLGIEGGTSILLGSLRSISG